MHPRKFTDSLHFQSWKVNLKTEVCAKSAFLHSTMHWITEVTIDDLLTSQSLSGRGDFLDFDMLDAMVASALKKLLTHAHLYAYRMTTFPPVQKWSWMVYTRQNCESFQLQTLGSVWTKFSDISEASYWSDSENATVQSPERNSGERSSNQESKRETSQRGKENGKMLSVESNWTVFKGRLM